MSDFKDRLLNEKAQLDERCGKLNSFIKSEKFETVHHVQQSFMKVQLDAMRTYSQCLAERLSWLEEEATVN